MQIWLEEQQQQHSLHYLAGKQTHFTDGLPPRSMMLYTYMYYFFLVQVYVEHNFQREQIWLWIIQYIIAAALKNTSFNNTLICICS